MLPDTYKKVRAGRFKDLENGLKPPPEKTEIPAYAAEKTIVPHDIHGDTVFMHGMAG